MKKAAILLSACLAAAPDRTGALECMVVTPEWMWETARQDPAEHLAIYGRLSPPSGEVTLGGMTAMTMRAATFRASFRGKALTRRGFTQPLEADLTVEPVCMVADCADLPYGVPIMAILKRRGEGLVLSLDACIDPIIERPTQTERARMRDCARDRCAEMDY